MYDKFIKVRYQNMSTIIPKKKKCEEFLDRKTHTITKKIKSQALLAKAVNTVTVPIPVCPLKWNILVSINSGILFQGYC